MAKVFVSYSRKDIEFAKRLTAELQENNLDFWIDWEGIPPTVDWWKEIEKGIEEADVFLFLISPDSSKSKVCGQEIDTAVANAKRIIPLVVRDVGGDEAPKQLSHLNWIFFRENDDYNAALQKLLTAIHTDYEWVQNHRRLQVKALEWERNNHDNGFLLRGKDLLDAETNLATNTSKEPHPTDLQRQYVFESRKAIDRQKRRTTSISIAGVVVLAALAVAAVIAALQAKQAQKQAEVETRRATAGQLALESKSVLDKYPQRALLLALESVRINQDANELIPPEAEEALRLASERVSGVGLAGFEYEPSIIQFTKDGKWLLAGTIYGKGEAHLWNIEKAINDPNYQHLSISFSLDANHAFDPINTSISFSSSDTWLVINTLQNGSSLWKVNVEDENRTPINFEGRIQFIGPKNETLIVDQQSDQTIIWQVNQETESKEEIQRLSGNSIGISKDGHYLVLNNPQEGVQLWDISTQPARMISTLTEKGFAAKTAFFDADYRWLIVVQEVIHPDILVETGYVDPKTDAWISIQRPWRSHNLWIYSLEDPNKPPVFFELNRAMNFDENTTGMAAFSPDGTGFVYDLFVNEGDYKLGYLNLKGDVPENTLVDSSYFYFRKFIGNHFITGSFPLDDTNEANGFLDLRDNSIVIDTDSQFMPENNLVSKDGKHITSGNQMLNIETLENTHEIVFEPIRPELFNQARETIQPSEFETMLRESPRLFGLEDNVSSTATSPDGHWFAVGATDGSMRLWDSHNPLGDTQITIPQEVSTGYIALSNDNRWLALGDLLWQLKDGKPIRSYRITTEGTYAGISVFSPDNRWLITVVFPKVWDENSTTSPILLTDLNQTLSQGAPVQQELKEIPLSSTQIQFSADSRWVIVEHENSFLYDLENHKAYDLPFKPIQAVFTSDQKHFVLVGESAAETWSLPEGNDALSPTGKIVNPDTAASLYTSQDGHWLIAVPFSGSTSGNTMRLWDNSCVLEKRTCEPMTLQGNHAAFSRDSQTLLAGLLSETNILNYEIWDLKSGTPQKTFSDSTDQIATMLGNSAKWVIFNKQAGMGGAFSSSTWSSLYSPIYTTFDGYGQILLWGGGGGGGGIGSYQIDYFVQALNTAQNQTVKMRGHESNISLNQISPNERYTLTFSGGTQDDGGDGENVLRLWDMDIMQSAPKTRGVILPYNNERKNAASNLSVWLGNAIFSPDSQWIYVIESGVIYEAETYTSTATTLYFYPTSIQTLQERACKAVGRNFIINEWERFFPNDTYHKTCENLPVHPSVNIEVGSNP